MQGVENAYTLELAGNHELCLLGMASFEDSHPLVKQLWSVAQLYDTSFPPLRWIVPGVLPTGLGFVSGRPKIGKSYLVMQISARWPPAVSCSAGVAQGRCSTWRAGGHAPPPARPPAADGHPAAPTSGFANDWPFSLGGAKDLLQEIGGGYSVVIVDTFSRAIGRADQMDATAMTLAMSQLHHIAAHEDVAPSCWSTTTASRRHGHGLRPDRRHLWLHRQGRRRRRRPRPLPASYGTPDATLKVTGRDVEEQELALHWDAVEHFNWVYRGDAEEHERTQREAEVINGLQGLGWASLRDLSDVTGQDRSNLHGRLQKLVEEGAVERKEQKGRAATSSSTAHSLLGFEDLDIPPAMKATTIRKDCSTMPIRRPCYHATTSPTTTGTRRTRCARVLCCHRGSVVAAPPPARRTRHALISSASSAATPNSTHLRQTRRRGMPAPVPCRRDRSLGVAPTRALGLPGR
ncbi:MAG: AAA family ATPase [Caldilineaceae bacterium]